jgi:hypothetical protein
LFSILNSVNKRTLRFYPLTKASVFLVANFFGEIFFKKIYKIFPFFKNFRPKLKKNKVTMFSTHCSSKQPGYKRILINFSFRGWSVAKGV